MTAPLDEDRDADESQRPETQAELPAWKQMLWGTVCLSLACTLPFVGWFLLLPYAGLVGIGGVIVGFFQRENKA